MAGKKALQAITLKKLGLAGGGATLRLGYQRQPSSLLLTEEEEKQAPSLGSTGSLKDTDTQQYQPGQDFELEKPSQDQKKQPSLTATSGNLMEKTLHMKEENMTTNQQEGMETSKEAQECSAEVMETDKEAAETSKGGASLPTAQSATLQFPVLPFSIFPEEVELPSQDRLSEPMDTQVPPPLFVDSEGRQAIVTL